MKIGFAPLKRGLNRGKIRVYDSFSREASALSPGNTETGQPWVIPAGVFGIDENGIYCVSHGAGTYDIAYIDSGLSDCAISWCKGYNLMALRPLFRYQDASNLFFIALNGGTYAIVCRKSGSNSVLLSTDLSENNGDIIRVRLNGSRISLEINGTSYGYIDDSSVQNATKHGFLTTIASNDRCYKMEVESI